MARKVSLWIVIALVGGLAATTAAVIVLATHDDAATPASAAGLQSDGEWSGGGYGDQDGSDSMMPPGAQGGGPMQIVGHAHAEWIDERDTPLLPWLLFAVATGAAVGLLIAWSPWRVAAVESTGPRGSAGRMADTEAAMTSAPPEDPAATAVTASTDEVAAPQTTESAGEVTAETVANDAPPQADEEVEQPSDL